MALYLIRHMDFPYSVLLKTDLLGTAEISSQTVPWLGFDVSTSTHESLLL
jgi:hypothetical protein